MKKIKVAIIGVGNCASSLIQGIEFYRKNNLVSGSKPEALGLMNYEIGGYRPQDIEIVCAFDIDKRKVGLPLKKAIFQAPNCTQLITNHLAEPSTIVQMGPVLDGIAAHMAEYPDDRRFIQSSAKPIDVVQILKKSGAEIALNYLPVGSQQATEYYAECCLHAGVSLINCIPVFIASNPEWAKRFADRGIPLVGDDVKSQVGATIVHRTLAKLFEDRGAKIDRTYQLNTGGNTDFLNMLNRFKLSGTTRELASLMQAARLEAIKMNAPAHVNYDASGPFSSTLMTLTHISSPTLQTSSTLPTRKLASSEM